MHRLKVRKEERKEMGKKYQFCRVLPTQDWTPPLFCLCEHLHTHTPHGRDIEVTAREFCVISTQKPVQLIHLPLEPIHPQDLQPLSSRV